MKHCATCKDRPELHPEIWERDDVDTAQTPCGLCRVFKQMPAGQVEYKDDHHYDAPQPNREPLKVDPFFWDDLTPTQKALVHVIDSNPGDSLSGWGRILGITKQAVHQHLAAMRKKLAKHSATT